MTEQQHPAPDWASETLRRTWPTLSGDDQRALIEDHENAVLRDLAVQMRHIEPTDDLGARPAGDFTLDGGAFTGMRWHAQRFDQPWNGSPTPVVTRETLENLIDDLRESGGAPGRVEPDGALTVVHPESGDVVIQPEDGLYRLYELGWCFVEVD